MWLPHQILPLAVTFMVGILGWAVVFGGGGRFFALCQVPTAVLIWRMQRGRIELRPDGVVIANVLRTRSIPWSAIERFETVTLHTLNRHPEAMGGLGVRLRDGRRVTCRGVGSLSGPWVFDILRAVRRAGEAHGIALVTPTVH